VVLFSPRLTPICEFPFGKLTSTSIWRPSESKGN
jgi:hypothetical protein